MRPSPLQESFSQISIPSPRGLIWSQFTDQSDGSLDCCGFILLKSPVWETTLRVHRHGARKHTNKAMGLKPKSTQSHAVSILTLRPLAMRSGKRRRSKNIKGTAKRRKIGADVPPAAAAPAAAAAAAIGVGVLQHPHPIPSYPLHPIPRPKYRPSISPPSRGVAAAKWSEVPKSWMLKVMQQHARRGAAAAAAATSASSASTPAAAAAAADLAHAEIVARASSKAAPVKQHYTIAATGMPESTCTTLQQVMHFVDGFAQHNFTHQALEATITGLEALQREAVHVHAAKRKLKHGSVGDAANRILFLTTKVKPAIVDAKAAWAATETAKRWASEAS